MKALMSLANIGLTFLAILVLIIMTSCQRNIGARVKVGVTPVWLGV
jgi:hypothetical protein